MRPWGVSRLVTASALAINSLSYKSVEPFLKNGLNQKPLTEQPPQSPFAEHGNVRGADYWQDLNLIISSPTGAGKTYLACALGHRACREGITVQHHGTPGLFQDFATAATPSS